jgi:hypothetical protein
MHTTAHHTLLHIPTGLFVTKEETNHQFEVPQFKGEQVPTLLTLAEAQEIGAKLCGQPTLFVNADGTLITDQRMCAEELEIFPVRVTMPRRTQNPEPKAEKSILAIREEGVTWFINSQGQKTKDVTQASSVEKEHGEEHISFIRGWTGLDILLINPGDPDYPEIPETNVEPAGPKEIVGKILTFQWTTTVQAPVDFKEADEHACRKYLDEAWANTQRSNGFLIDVIDEPA